MVVHREHGCRHWLDAGRCLLGHVVAQVGAVKFLYPNDDAVAEFLWTHLVPRQLNAASKGEAFRFVWDEVMAERQWLVGDLEAGLVFRVNLRNPLVLELHIMGNVARMRSSMAEGMAIAWKKNWSGHGYIQRVVIVSTLEPMTRILPRIGWKYEHTIDRAHFDGERLQPLYLFSLENPNAAQA